jgi:anti-sigma factor RsiW
MSERCDRARQWASLELDGELSELERSLLQAHLERCAECAPVVAEVRAIAARMREMPLEQPSLTAVAPRRRPRVRAFQVGVAAATVAIGISLGSLAGSLSHSGSNTSAHPNFSQALIAMLRANAPQHDSGRMIPV